jgi:hypothetical protein
MTEAPKTPGQFFIEALIKSGAIKTEDDLTPDQLIEISELNQSRDVLAEISKGLPTSPLSS